MTNKQVSQADELAKVLHYYGLLEGDDAFKIVCPFHGDVNASMQITLSENFFYCHGCGEHGDAMKFVRLANPKLDELGACIKYHRILKSRKVSQIKMQNIRLKAKPGNVQALHEAEDYYFGLKSNDWSEDSFEKEYMLDRGFTERALDICKAKINANIAYPIIFPMFDMQEFKGWVCRTMDKRIEKKRKYLYNEGFSRRNTLVGNYDSKVVVIVEGYMDWLKFRMYGIKHVSAILGWKLSAEQKDKLKKSGVKYIISALDNDVCGIKGTKVLEKDFDVIRFQFPIGTKDPGEMTKEQFKKAYEKTKKEFRRIQKWD